MKENKDMLAACDAISKCMNTQCCSGFVPTPPSGSDTCIGKRFIPLHSESIKIPSSRPNFNCKNYSVLNFLFCFSFRVQRQFFNPSSLTGFSF